MKKQPIKHQTDGLIALLLFGVFSVCVLAVLLTGADAYRRLTSRDQSAYDQRTCIQYIAIRVRQADRLGGVAVEEFGGSTALVLSDEEEGGQYITRIYWHDGYIMELYSEAGLELSPEAGQLIMPAGELNFDLDLDANRLAVTAAGEDGEAGTLLLSLRSGEGAVG